MPDREYCPEANYGYADGSLASTAPSLRLRQALEYVEANWNRPITIKALAKAVGTSERSVFYDFKEAYGLSPMAFVKEVRLHRAKDMLMQGDLDRSVTDTAFACGFVNLAHFAKNYSARFGVRPSDTLRRMKAGLRR